jgi:hypothetical protein
MSLRTNISGKHLIRLTVVGLFCLGFGLWALYDGKVTYPNQRKRALAFQEHEEQGRLEEWTQYTAERGWEPYDPGEPKTESEITVQFVMFVVAGGAGLLVLIHVLRCRGRWIEMDETGLRTSRGQTVAFGQITEIDKKKWDKKGIAKLQYQENGRDSVLTLDDFIYERPTTDDMLRQVEEHVGHDKIVNGKPEPPPKAEAAPAEPSASANNSQS